MSGRLSPFWRAFLSHGCVQAAKIRKQQEEIEFVKREAAAVAQELENANTAKNITETNRTLSSKSVDEQLQSKGYSVKTSGCSAFGHYYPSRKDTEGNQRQVLNHNLTYEKSPKEGPK